MSWLGGWLREIILVVLLASFVELLLPSKSMERYARLVLSLLILLTMLSPIVSLLKGDAISELSVAMGQQEKEGGLFTGGGKEDPSLEQILADGQKLAQGRQEQSLQLAAEEVAGQMKEQIISETGKRGVNVTVTLGMGKSGGTGNEDVPVISNVRVSMPQTTANSPGTSGASSTATTAPITISPVAPVEVKIGANPADNVESEATSSAEPNKAVNGTVAEDSASASEMESIVKLLELKWDLDPKVIQVDGSVASNVKS
ncbi:stage III sporulation protein AF [Paenibacillus odorifer]|uniref:stage III sporulation protein AF n=1 Tax=Paenibacillus odorifer TaxID=189426 RepID=UPI00096EDCFD|nr:stage III sporulation protein AF [Paenibacillus odorifer]OMC73251.1 stage III sporulation protein AF [Paenibacillus odorifer]